MDQPTRLHASESIKALQLAERFWKLPAESRSAFKFMEKLARKYESLLANTSENSKKGQTWYYYWLKLAKRLRSTQRGAARLIILQKYLVSVGYLGEIKSDNAGNNSKRGCANSSSQQILEENNQLLRERGFGLSDVQSAREYYHRELAYALLKFLESFTRLLKKVVPEIEQGLGTLISESVSPAGSGSDLKKPPVVLQNYHETLFSWMEMEIEATEETMEVLSKIKETNLLKQCLSLLFSQSNPREPPNLFLGNRLYGKLEEIGFNPDNLTYSRWGVLHQNRKARDKKLPCNPIASYLDPSSFSVHYEDLGLHYMEENADCAKEFEKMKKEAGAFKIEHPLRDKRIALNLASLCISFAAEVDSILGGTLVDDGGMYTRLAEEEGCPSTCVSSFEGSFGRLIEFGESISLLMDDAYGLHYIAGLHVETDIKKQCKKLWRNFLKYLDSRNLGSVKQESIDADDPDGVVTDFQKKTAETPEAPPSVGKAPGEPLSAETPGPQVPVGGPFSTTRRTKRMMNALVLKIDNFTRETELKAPSEEIDDDDVTSPSEPITIQDRVLKNSKALVTVCKILSTKFLKKAFKVGVGSLVFKSGYRSLEAGEKHHLSWKHVLQEHVNLVTDFKESLEVHCDVLINYFSTPEGNLQKPSLEHCAEAVSKIYLIIKKFRLTLRLIYLLSYSPWSGTPRSYCFYQNVRYLEKKETSACYYYNKISAIDLHPPPDPCSTKPSIGLKPACCNVGTQGTGISLASSFGDELPRLDFCLYGAFRAMEKISAGCLDDSLHVLKNEACLGSRPFSYFFDYTSSGILDDEDDTEEALASRFSGSRDALLATKEVVGAGKFWLTLKRAAAPLARKYVEFNLGVFLLVVKFYQTYLGTDKFSDSSDAKEKRSDTEDRYQEVDIYEYPRGETKTKEFVVPTKKGWNPTKLLKESILYPLDSLAVTRSNVCAIFDVEPGDELQGLSVLKNMMKYKNSTEKVTWELIDAMRTWAKVSKLFKYDAILTDPSYASQVVQAVDVDKQLVSDRGLREAIYAAFGKKSVDELLIEEKEEKFLVSELATDNCRICLFLMNVLQPAHDATREVAVEIERSFPRSKFTKLAKEFAPPLESSEAAGSEEAATVEETAPATPTAPEPATTGPPTSVGSKQRAFEERQADEALIGADFWTNHHRIDRTYKSAWNKGREEGFEKGYAKGKTEGLELGRGEIEDTTHLVHDEVAVRFQKYEDGIGDVVVHLYLPCKDLPTVAENEAYTSDALDLSRDLMAYYANLGDSKAFLEEFNSMGDNQENKQFYREFMWKTFRKSRYAKHWSSFDLCWKAWGKLYHLGEIVQMRISETKFEERILTKDMDLNKLSGARFFSPKKYPHPANMFYCGMAYRKLLEKVPLLYGHRDYSMSIMSAPYRSEIRNLYKNFARGKDFRSYISRCIKLYDWTVTNLKPVLYTILMETQNFKSPINEGSKLPAFKPVLEASPEHQEHGNIVERAVRKDLSSSEEDDAENRERVGTHRSNDRQPDLEPGIRAKEGSGEIFEKQARQETGEEVAPKKEQNEREEEEEEEETKTKSVIVNIGGSFSATRSNTIKGPDGRLTTITATTTDPEVARRLRDGTQQERILNAVLDKEDGREKKNREGDPDDIVTEEKLYEAYEFPDRGSVVPEKNPAVEVEKEVTVTAGSVYENFIDSLSKLKMKKKLVPQTGFMFGPSMNLLGPSQNSELESAKAGIDRDFVDTFMTSLAVIQFECSAAMRKLKGKEKKIFKIKKSLKKEQIRLNSYYTQNALEQAQEGNRYAEIIGGRTKKAPETAPDPLEEVIGTDPSGSKPSEKIGGKLSGTEFPGLSVNELGDAVPWSKTVSPDAWASANHNDICDGTDLAEKAFWRWITETVGEYEHQLPDTNPEGQHKEARTLEEVAYSPPTGEGASLAPEGSPEPSPGEGQAGVGTKLWEKIIGKSKNKLVMDFATMLHKEATAKVTALLKEPHLLPSGKKGDICSGGLGGNSCKFSQQDKSAFLSRLYERLQHVMVSKDGKKSAISPTALTVMETCSLVVLLDPSANGTVQLGAPNIFLIRRPETESYITKTNPSNSGSSSVWVAGFVEEARPGVELDTKSNLMQLLSVPPPTILFRSLPALELKALPDVGEPHGRHIIVDTRSIDSSKRFAVMKKYKVREGSETVASSSPHLLDKYIPKPLYEVGKKTEDDEGPLIFLNVYPGNLAPATPDRVVATLDYSRRGSGQFGAMTTLAHPAKVIYKGTASLNFLSKSNTEDKLGDMPMVVVMLAPRGDGVGSIVKMIAPMKK